MQNIAVMRYQRVANLTSDDPQERQKIESIKRSLWNIAYGRTILLQTDHVYSTERLKRRRQAIMDAFTIEDMHNPVIAESVKEALENIDQALGLVPESTESKIASGVTLVSAIAVILALVVMFQ